MAAPILNQTYPSDGSSGLPVGISIELIFDKGIDIETAKNSIVLYGADYDVTSGPDQATWADDKDFSNEFYLKSPGFTGVVPLDYRVVYWNLDDDELADEVVITSEADELSASIGHKVICTPKSQLAGDTEYTLYVMGDPDSVNNGISARTVFDVEPDAGNSGTDNRVIVYGGYNRNIADTVVIEITTSGDIGTAKYRWYYTSAGVAEAVSGKVTSRRYRLLEDGMQIRFDGDGFVAGDIYEFNVEPIERLATNTIVRFNTSDGSFTEAPESPSTPATSSPPSSVLPPFGDDSESAYLQILNVTPDDRAYNISIDVDTIIIEFDEDIDPATITDDTVKLFKTPASGYYSETEATKELSKAMTITDNILTIRF